MKLNLYIETYGCQMNLSDSEIVASILADKGVTTIANIPEADIILLNTCSVRDNAEQRIRKRLKELKSLKKKKPSLIVGIIGCMAERQKENLFAEEEIVDLIVGPDAYRDLPSIIERVEGGMRSANVLLSTEETYADINPVRYHQNKISAFISIMRGCENFCTYCVVPYTRGKERSRNPETIIREAKNLFENGYKEVTLLGQNVNSYHFEGYDFARLIREVAMINPLLRVRFTTSHPKDISDELLLTIAENKNICRSIHLPVQAGSTRMLEKMNRKYTRENYMERIEAIRRYIPDCSISTDIIAGFSSESEEDHQQTLSLMEWVGYDYAYMFKYSVREGTDAAKLFEDDVPEETKLRRLAEIIALQRKLSLQSNKKDVGNVVEVLVENVSKRSNDFLSGRNSQNKTVVFPRGNFQIGDYVKVKITDCTAATLKGDAVGEEE